MAQGVLTSKGTFVPHQTICKLRISELHSETEKRKRQIFDDIIKTKLGDSMLFPPKSIPSNNVPYSDDCEPNSLQLPDDNDPINSESTSVFKNQLLIIGYMLK